MLPTTVHRVPDQTNEEVNECIRRQSEQRIAKLKQAGQAAISRRLEELDAEWDIERTLEANAATASLVGLTLGATVDKRWFIFPGIVATFLLQHALQGWCPPLPIFRRLGFRTASEIDYERYALKAIRGDFEEIPHQKRHGGQKLADQALNAAEL
jgi:hypothetical protein